MTRPRLRVMAMISGSNAARLMLTVAGLLAITWAVMVARVFRAENVIADVAQAVRAGETFKPEVLAAVEKRAEPESGSMLRSSVLSKVDVIRLRQAEDALRAGDFKLSEQRLRSLAQSMDGALDNAPNDAFLWLARFWLDVTRNGLRDDNLPFLRMSYHLGPHEGWIDLKRDRIALAAFAALPKDLAEQAISEFVGLVRWGLVSDAADIAAETLPPLRRILFSGLKDLSDEQRRAFANVVYGRELDDVAIPGFAVPAPQIPMPVLPPDL